MQLRTSPNINRYLAISRAVAGQLDFTKVLREIAGEVSKLIPHDHMDVTIILPDKPDFHVAYEVGMETSWGGASEPQPNEMSPIRLLLFGEVTHLMTGDAWKDPRFHFEGAFDEPIFDAKLHSRLHVPMQVQGKIHGSLNISNHKCDVYSAQDLEVARNIADLIAPYFYALIKGQQAERSALAEGAARGRAEALRQGALRLTEGMERERRRLGMELHDQTLADLTRIYRRIERINSKGSKVKSGELENIEEELARCTRELRRIIEDAKPGILELFGFRQAVEAQLERSVIGSSPPIATSVIDQADGLIDRSPDPIRTAIFRIVQEAINNAVNHGKCRSIKVTIHERSGGIEVKVTDDGPGPAKDWNKSTGGLDNMRVRAALISASISFVQDEESTGTSVVILLPSDAMVRVGNDPSAQSGLSTQGAADTGPSEVLDELSCR
ncbi:MAG: ATP-binding protein [Rhizobiaceae bacterium]